MRAVVRRVHPWSAAKVGAFVGIAGGLVAGTGLAALGATLSPMLAYFGEPVVLPSWPAVILGGVFGGAACAVLSAVGALLYNLFTSLGAAFVVDLTTEDTEPTPAGGRARAGKHRATGAFAHPSFTAPEFGR